MPVHPRAGGEHSRERCRWPPSTGSSPRGRGTHNQCRYRWRTRRFIPARAGEHRRPPSVVNPAAGSSPRGRGTQCKACLDPGLSRFIPALAGRGDFDSRGVSSWDRSKCGNSSLHTRAGLSRARSARGRGCPMTRGRGSARGLVQCRRGRTAEQREPVVDPLSGQALVSAGPLVPSPAPGAQIEPGTEQVEKALSGALVDVEIGA